jgi:L-rhamnose mutarotase
MQFAKLKKKSEEKNYSIFLNEKMQNILQKTHFGYIHA